MARAQHRVHFTDNQGQDKDGNPTGHPAGGILTYTLEIPVSPEIAIALHNSGIRYTTELRAEVAKHVGVRPRQVGDAGGFLDLTPILEPIFPALLKRLEPQRTKRLAAIAKKQAKAEKKRKLLREKKEIENLDVVAIDAQIARLKAKLEAKTAYDAAVAAAESEAA